ncbi:MAG TPA: hypothetical protein VIW25_09475 [Nitrososphaeraceae archaeon]|jgi:hypothetical protein
MSFNTIRRHNLVDIENQIIFLVAKFRPIVVTKSNNIAEFFLANLEQHRSMKEALVKPNKKTLEEIIVYLKVLNY